MNTLRSVHERIKLEPEKGSFTSEPDAARYSNKDLDPVPLERKKWEWYHVGGFWIAEGFNVAQLETPSSAVALGLNPGLTIVACLIGNLLVTLPTMSSGYLGSKYGLNFPVISRSSFGMKGAYVAMVIRAVVCVIWYGVQSSVGGNAVRCMVEAIWPSFKGWHINSLPPSASITAPDLLSFALFWIISFPFLFLSIPALRWMFIVKCFIMPFFGVVLFTWALTAAHGWGPLFRIPNNIQGGWSVGYAFCLTITGSISGNATFAINMSDITRYAHDRKRAWQMQALLPVMITLTELLGTVMAASAQVVYGQVLWNPLDVVALWDNRAGKFFAGFCFAFANIATNVAGNSIPFANDVTGMFPKYINIRRGQIICAILGWAICPWLLQAKAQRFFAFLNGYTVFLGPLIGILISDYWLIRRRNGGLNVYQLYKPGGLYWFTGGVNPRALAALLIGITPLLPGLIHNINPDISVSRGIQAFYTLSWLDGLVLSGLSYYLLYLAFPFPTNLRETNGTYDGESPDGSEALEESRVDVEKSVKPEGDYIRT